jgi:hypothetical protein
VTEKKPTLEYGRTARRWHWWDTLFLLAINPIIAAMLYSALARAWGEWGIFNVRVGLTRL